MYSIILPELHQIYRAASFHICRVKLCRSISYHSFIETNPSSGSLQVRDGVPRSVLSVEEIGFWTNNLGFGGRDGDEMRCVVGLLLMGLCLGVEAHNTPKIRNGTEFHAPFTDSHENMRASWPEGHWHYSEGRGGAWDRCVADSYKESTDKYDFALMRVKCREGGRSTDSDANPPPTIHPEVPRDEARREPDSSEN